MRKSIYGLLIIWCTLILIYSPTLLTIISGSSDDFMNDVGETQIVLNTWGTLHATGYPLFVMLGSLIVSIAKAIGVSPASAPTLVSLLWGLAALTMIYILGLHLTGKVELAVGATVLFGLTRYVWVHCVIPEVYSFALLILSLLMLIALWKRDIPQRILWLALIGGIGIGHHRGLLLAIPALVYSVWDELIIQIRKQPLFLVVLFITGLMGLLPYIYLPLRAWSGSTWVYGSPGTLNGLWAQFIALESTGIVAWPVSLSALAERFNTINILLVTELSAPVILLGIAGLLLTACDPQRRRVGLTFLILGLTTYLFVVVLFTDILAPVILPITLSLVLGCMFLADVLLSRANTRRYVYACILPITLVYGTWLTTRNFPFIYSLTHDPTGLQTITAAEKVPPGSTLVLAWGVRYFAIGFAQDVLGELKNIHRVDDKADFGPIIANGMLVTPDYTFQERPLRWWRDKLETKVYLRAVGPHLVQIDTKPQLITPEGVSLPKDYNETMPVVVVGQVVQCLSDSIILQVDWLALKKPTRNASIFVHLLNSKGELLAQSDQSAPVYSWRPITTWDAGEVVRDFYPMPSSEDAATIWYGLYEQLPSGEYKNYNTMTLPINCR